MLNLSSCSAFPSKVLSFSFFFSLQNNFANQFKHCWSVLPAFCRGKPVLFSFEPNFHDFVFLIQLMLKFLCRIFICSRISNKELLIIIIVYPWRIWWGPARIEVFLTLVNFPSFKPLNASFALWKHVLTNPNEELRNQIIVLTFPCFLKTA